MTARCASPMCRSQASNNRVPKIAAPEAETEREADRVADEVINGQRGSGSVIAAGTPSATLHRSVIEAPTAGPVAKDANRAASALGSAGHALDPSLRSYFEPRFGTDLSEVRLHRDEPAAEAINARAYTKGRDIAFAPGAFDPGSRDGLRLIAHELAHTLQGGDMIHRDGDEDDEELAPNPYLDATVSGEADSVLPISNAPPTTRTDQFDDNSGGGESRFEEIVSNTPTINGDLIEGEVRRREIAPTGGGPDGTAEQELSDKTRPVVFDASACEIRLEHSFGFTVEADDPRGDSCQGDAIDQAGIDVNQVATNYMNAVRDAMNNEFVIRLSGCEHDCASQDIPIRIVLTRDDADPDTAISLVARGGRADARTMCMGNFDTQLPIHEGGHQILGRGDEYPERDADLLATVPQWGNPARVRNDYNVMGSRRRFGRFAVFHERDFRHVLTFMRAALPDCTSELVSVGDIILDYRLFLRGGVGTLSGSTALSAGFSFDVGIPVTRGREWSVLVGAHADYLAQVSGERRRLILAGMRVGFERQFHGPTVSGRVFGGGGMGVSHELERSTRDVFGEREIEHGPRTSAFGQLDAGAGMMVHTGSGGALTADLRLSGGGEITASPDAAYWFNAGVMLGARF